MPRNSCKTRDVSCEGVPKKTHGSHLTAHRSSGNVFLIILIAVALFAALSFTVSRGLRSTTTTTMSEREIVLAATDVLTYAQQLERGVNRLRRKGTSESDISFDQSFVAGYTHGSPQPDSNKIFSTSGGAIKWRDPAQGTNDGSDWVFTGATCIPNIGTGASGCDSDSSARTEELLAVFPNVDEGLCTELNKRLDITGIPADTGGGASGTQFTGSFADGTEIILAGGPYNEACFSRGGNHFFYAVLLAR